jgi:hypothetical protein
LIRLLGLLGVAVVAVVYGGKAVASVTSVSLDEAARTVAEAVATDATEDNTEALLVLDEFLVAISSSKRRLVRLETAPARIEGEDQAAKSDAEARASIGPRCGRAGHKLRGAKSKTLTSRRPRPRSSTLRHPAGRPQST